MTIDAKQLVQEMGTAARKASRVLALTPATQKSAALHHAADTLLQRRAAILQANALDLQLAEAKGQSAAYLDRLCLNPDRLHGIAESLRAIAAQPDPIGTVLADWHRPNGLHIQQVRVPIGVIGIIFEARPNVTADAGALCLKSGNAAFLRCGADSLQSSLAILDCLHAGLKQAGLPQDSIQLVNSEDRAVVTAMLQADGLIDVIIPRGGRSLTETVARESRVPVIKHLDGICHIYLDTAASLEKAVSVVHNAKLRRVGVCGAAETLLIHRAILHTIGKAVLMDLLDASCAIHGDAACQALDKRILPASEADWQTEYLAPVIAAKTVASITEAMEHIHRYGSHHTDCIITEDTSAAATFTTGVDSGIVMVNTSTQFADGGEFGFGAEIGISTDKLHARGPVGAQHLTSSKYIVVSNGSIRP